MARTTNAKRTTEAKGTDSGVTVGYEAQLWQMTDALRDSMDAAEYNHVVHGLIFLKYISDAFGEQHARLETERATGADLEDPDEYRAVNIFWVRPEAYWAHLKAQARQSEIGEFVDDATTGIERNSQPFNLSDWGGERHRDNRRWQYGLPPAGNANLAWVQHILHHHPHSAIQ